MSTEAALWKLMRASGLPGHWVRVENRVEAGTPDLNYCVEGIEGWGELKAVDRWPAGAWVPLRVPHFTKQQRFWLRRRIRYGGRAHVLIRVGRTYLVLPGEWAAERLGEAPELEMREMADGVWDGAWDLEAFLKALSI